MQVRTVLRWSTWLLCGALCGCPSSSKKSSDDAGTNGDAGVAGAGASGAGAGTQAGAGGMGGGAGTTAAHVPTATTGTVERGEYLVDHVLMCGVCHTPTGKDGKPNMGLYLAGSRSYDFTDVDGTIVTVNAENLTSHDPEGLHSWSDEQVRTALTKGIDDEMVALYPIMPFPEYSLLTREDIDSIIQYLRTVPPNDNVVAADFPYFNQFPPVKLANDSDIPHTTLAKTDPDYDSAERGRYIAKTACLYCHTEELSAGIPDMTKAFAGGKVYTFIRGASANTSTNLTPDATGLEGWSVQDIVDAIKSNKEKGTGRALCSTHPGGPERLGMMKDADVKDLATYIHNLAPIKNGPFKCEK